MARKLSLAECISDYSKRPLNAFKINKAKINSGGMDSISIDALS